MVEDSKDGACVIRVREPWGRVWAMRFPDMEITTAADEGTVLSAGAIDQAALHGLLTRIRDLGPTIVSVERCERSDEADVEGPLRTGVTERRERGGAHGRRTKADGRRGAGRGRLTRCTSTDSASRRSLADLSCTGAEAGRKSLHGEE